MTAKLVQLNKLHYEKQAYATLAYLLYSLRALSASGVPIFLNASALLLRTNSSSSFNASINAGNAVRAFLLPNPSAARERTRSSLWCNAPTNVEIAEGPIAISVLTIVI